MTRANASYGYSLHPGYATTYAAPALPAQSAAKPLNKIGEWYLTLCLLMLLIEGVFNEWLNTMIPQRSIIIFRLTPWNLWPSVMYFYSIGFAIGLWIFFSWRKPWHAQTKGIFLLMAMWFVYFGWGLYGWTQRNVGWLADVRSYILPSVIAPWVATLGKDIRLDVVARRFVTMAIPGAVLNAMLGISFFARGGGIGIGYGVLEPSWQAEYTLLLAYVLAFARSIASGKRATITLLILAAGITAPLHKPALATFFFANLALLWYSVQLGRRWKTIRIGNAVIVLVALMFGGLVFGGVMMSIGGGAGKEFILNRIFKYHVRAHKRDVAGGRGHLWAAAIHDWAESPLIGQGLGGRIVVGAQGAPRIVPLHNLYIQTLAQTGLLGLSIVIVAVVTWYIRARRAIRDEYDERLFWPRLGMFTWVVTMLFASGYGGVLGASCIAFLLWICVGLETGAHSQQEFRQPAY